MLFRSKHITAKKTARIVKKATVKAGKASNSVTQKIQDIKTASSARGKRAAARKKVVMKKLAKKKTPQLSDKINLGKIDVISISGTSNDGRSVNFTFKITHKDQLLKNRNPAYKYFTLS